MARGVFGLDDAKQIGWRAHLFRGLEPLLAKCLEFHTGTIGRVGITGEHLSDGIFDHRGFGSVRLTGNSRHFLHQLGGDLQLNSQ